MAVDEALLETATLPTLRFYNWLGPALSFGYFGKFAAVADQQADREIVRRWTGGGIVLHGDDLTYSVIIPESHPTFARSSRQIYSELHEAIQRTLRVNGIEAALVVSATPKMSDDCFANPVPADVISAGRKIAGAAQRRTRAGLLHQGSIQLAKLPPRLAQDFARTLCPSGESRCFSRPLLDRAHAIAESKYSTRDWLTRR